MALAWMFSIGLFRVLRWSVPSTWPLARLVATALVRSRMGTRLCFLTLLLASLILNLVPHLLRSAEVALAPDTTKSRPDLFLFNIPESGLSDIEAFAKQQGAQLQYVSPLILGRLMRVNGVDTENDQFQRFPVRLTVRTEMLNSERLVEGPPLPNRASDQGPLPISMEKGFAERNGFRLGDTIDFDIQGVPVSGRVINFRQVDWKSFHPNFFMSFPHGLLDDAPKVWIANWTFSQSRPDGAEVQSKLTEKFPDVNVIAVGPALNKVLDLIRSVIGPVEAAAMIAAVLSLAIVMAVIAHNVSLRSTEIQIMRVFGAVPERVVTVLMSEYVGLALLATAAASLFGIACAGAVGWRVFQLHFPDELHFDFARAAISSAALVALIAFVAWRSVARSMRAKSSL
jgi:putative ABC transport system permease protein